MLPKELTWLRDAALAPSIPIDGDSRATMGRGHPQVQGPYHPISLLLCLFLWRKGDCAVRFSSRGGLDTELMFSDGMGANILPCRAGGSCEQPMVSPWDFLYQCGALE